MMNCRISALKNLIPVVLSAITLPLLAAGSPSTLPATNPNFRKLVKQSPPSPSDVKPPPASQPVPLLTPEEEIKTMHLAPGFHMEVVASEPMVEHPVQMSWDPDGRLYVVEMRGYMPDFDGNGEDQPLGRISLLEDTDGDGQMDKSTVFWDKLVMPRTVAAVRDGALAAVPPNLYFCRDTNGDGVADEKTVVLTDYGMSDNVEHIANGLLYGLDNWMYSTSYDKRLRFQDGHWLTDITPTFGQWGIGRDDWGRLFHNTNSDHLRGGIIPPHYADRNSHYRATSFNEQIAKDQTCWPSHNTAENRGYLENFLREDGTLKAFTAACAPMIYRGGIFPDGFAGNAFVCEASANIVRRDVITEKDGVLTAQNAYPDREFIASTYERFRPVNLQTGPDGAIYVVDMHHGLIQHRLSLTAWNTANYLQRKLNLHLNTGRIFRIVPDGAKLYPKPELSKATSQELIDTLSHPNGWWRDTAQRMLIERGESRVVPLLRKVMVEGPNPLTRLHALWTLEGFGRLNTQNLAAALGDQFGKVRANAIRLCEPILYSPRRSEILQSVLKLAEDHDPDVRLQFALSVSPLGTPETDSMLARIITESSDNKYLRDAILSGLRGREFEFLQRLMKQPEWNEARDGRPAAVSALAQAIVAEANPKHIAQLLDLIPVQSGGVEWRQKAMLAAFPNVVKGRRVRSVLLDSPPLALLALRREEGDELSAQLPKAFEIVHWPGDPAYTPPVPPRPLTVVEQARFEQGRKVFAATCIQCHKANGLGQEGLAPPLIDSEWVLGSEQRLARIVLQGLNGPINVNGRSYTYEMPTLSKLSDEDIAAALTYVRREWDHAAAPVEPKTLTEIRNEVGNRLRPWSERELLQIP